MGCFREAPGGGAAVCRDVTAWESIDAPGEGYVRSDSSIPMDSDCCSVAHVA